MVGYTTANGFHCIIIPGEGHGPGEAGATVVADNVLELAVDGLDVDPEAGGLGAGVAALLAHLVLDLEVDALLVRLQLRLGRERLPAVVADVVPAQGQVSWSPSNYGFRCWATIDLVNIQTRPML